MIRRLMPFPRTDLSSRREYEAIGFGTWRQILDGWS